MLAQESNVRGAISWSAAYLVVTRLSAFAVIPLILGELGANLYAVWVLCGTLIMSQGLLDLGASQALARFVAVGYTHESCREVAIVARRGAIFYFALSVIVAVPAWVFAGSIVGILQDLTLAEMPDAVALCRYAAVTFCLTNVTLVLRATLLGLNRADASYRGETLGWLLYAPTVVIGLGLSLGVHSLGLAWIAAYGTQIFILLPTCIRAVRVVPARPAQAPSLREMVSVGTTWQVAPWADFVTLQIPRLLGGIAVSTGALVSIDLAIRLGQALVSPLTVLTPLVLPRVTSVYTRYGLEGVRHLLFGWLRAGTFAVFVGVLLVLPLGAPTIATWTGRPFGRLEVVTAAVVIFGIAAHSATGVFSASLLAVGRLRLVVLYKLRQLMLSVALLAAAIPFGTTGLAVAVALGLAAPAITFMVQTGAFFGLSPPSQFRPPTRVAVMLVVSVTLLFALVLVGTDYMSALEVLATSASLAVIAAAACLYAFGFRVRTRPKLVVVLRPQHPAV